MSLFWEGWAEGRRLLRLPRAEPCGRCAARPQPPPLLPPCQELAESAHLARAELVDLVFFSPLGRRTGASGITLHTDKRGEMSREGPFSQFPFAKTGGTSQGPPPTPPAMADILLIAAGYVIKVGHSPPTPRLRWQEGCSSPWQSLRSAHKAFPGTGTKRGFNWCPLGCRAGPLPCRAARNKCCKKRDSEAHGERDRFNDKLAA